MEKEKERFNKEIQPLFRASSIREIEKACHCSLGYASLIKKGNNVPRPVFLKSQRRQLS
jgi:hypothetical protein